MKVNWVLRVPQIPRVVKDTHHTTVITILNGVLQILLEPVRSSSAFKDSNVAEILLILDGEIGRSIKVGRGRIVKVGRVTGERVCGTLGLSEEGVRICTIMRFSRS